MAEPDVLLVSTDKDTVERLCAALAAYRLSSFVAGNALDAMEALATWLSPRLVIVDASLPSRDVETLQRLWQSLLDAAGLSDLTLAFIVDQSARAPSDRTPIIRRPLHIPEVIAVFEALNLGKF